MIRNRIPADYPLINTSRSLLSTVSPMLPVDLLDHAIQRGGDGGLHFHGLHHQELVALA